MFAAIWTKLKVSTDGAAAVEFALVLPALAALMFGTLQAGLLVFTYNTMVSAARDATRSMAVCSIDAATAVARAKTYRPPWIPDAAWTISDDNAAPNATMTITVPTTTAMILSYVPFDLPTLTATVTMLEEPEGYGGGSCSA